MSLQNAKVGQQVFVSFKDAPKCNAVITEIDMLEMKKVLRGKQGTVSMRILMQRDDGTFASWSIEHTQIVSYGAMISLSSVDTKATAEDGDVQNRLFKILAKAVDGNNAPIDIGGDGKISYHMLVESGDFDWSHEQDKELTELAVGQTSSTGIRRIR